MREIKQKSEVENHREERTEAGPQPKRPELSADSCGESEAYVVAQDFGQGLRAQLQAVLGASGSAAFR